jgi:hypothetical protein
MNRMIVITHQTMTKMTDRRGAGYFLPRCFYPDLTLEAGEIEDGVKAILLATFFTVFTWRLLRLCTGKKTNVFSGMKTVHKTTCPSFPHGTGIVPSQYMSCERSSVLCSTEQGSENSLHEPQFVRTRTGGIGMRSFQNLARV